jgi:tetratricopeptide (TPR) repeat protein
LHSHLQRDPSKDPFVVLALRKRQGIEFRAGTFMSASSSSAATLVHDTLSQANQQFEKIWEQVLSFSDPTLAVEDSRAACRRLISYNPMNQAVGQTSPNIKKATDVISQIIISRGLQIQGDPYNPEHYVVLGHCYLILNDFPNAFTAYSHVLRLGVPPADSAYFQYALACVLHHFNYERDAQVHIQESLRQSPPYLTQGDLRLRLALIQRSIGDYDVASASLDAVLQAALPPKLTQDDILFQIAFTQQLANRFDKAQFAYTELLKRHPHTIEVVQQYCWFLSLQHDRATLEKAERVIQQSGNPGDPVLKLVSARIAMKQQDMSLAYQRYCDCIAFWTDSPIFWCGLGVLYFKNEQMQDAIVAFQRALFLKPELAEAWANLGLIFEMQKETATATAVYQQALQSCSDKDAKIVRDRLNAINGGRPRQPMASQVIDVNDSPFFVQVAAKIAADWIADSPTIPARLIGADDSLDLIIGEMTPPHRSIF